MVMPSVGTVSWWTSRTRVRAAAGRLVPGEDVVALRRDGLPLRADAEAAEEVFEVGGDAVLENVRAAEVAAHRVDARQGDQIAQQAGGFVHECTPKMAVAAVAVSRQALTVRCAPRDLSTDHRPLITDALFHSFNSLQASA